MCVWWGEIKPSMRDSTVGRARVPMRHEQASNALRVHENMHSFDFTPTLPLESSCERCGLDSESGAGVPREGCRQTDGYQI